MNMLQLLDKMIHQHIAVSLSELQLELLTIERDLQVLGSQFGPDLHELNAQLDQFRKRVEHYAFDDQDKNDKAGGQEPPATPAE
jgi:hypothetical protein